MTESLDGLKKDYEDKLISFESLLKESNSKIQELQDYDPIIRLIKSNPDIITHYKESLERKIAGKPDEQGNDQIKQQISEEDQKKLALFEKKVAQMELIMQKKDKIYEECNSHPFLPTPLSLLICDCFQAPCLVTGRDSPLPAHRSSWHG